MVKVNGGFLVFSNVLYSILFHLPRPSDSIVSEDAGIESRTSALAVSNHSAKSHPW
jgi:hypothetical protein